jgi:hypothetical protein
MKKKTWMIIAAAALAVIAVIAAAIALDMRGNRRAEAKRYEHSINCFYSDEEGVTRFVVDSVVLEDRVSGRVDSFLSCDGSAAIVRAGTGLYRVDREGVLLVHPAGVDLALLSLDNNVIVFTTATEVHIYDHHTGKVEDVKPDGVTGIASIVLSPNGGTVGYTVKTAEGAFVSYAHENGESRLLRENAYIAAIADGAEFYYYVEPNEAALNYVSDSRVRKIGVGVSGIIEFNRELTEAAFDMNGVTYYSVEGGAAKTLIAGESVYSMAAECESVQGGGSLTASVKDCSSLFGCLFYSKKTSSEDKDAAPVYDLWYVDGLKRETALVRGALEFELTDDGGRLSCLLSDGKVYLMDADDPAAAGIVCYNVASYDMDGRGRDFYCIGKDNALYCVSGGAQPVKLAVNAVYCSLFNDDLCLFLARDGSKLTLGRAGGISQAEIVASGVANVSVMPFGAFYYTETYTDEYGSEVCDVFSSGNGLDWSLAVKAASLGSGGNN